MRTYLAAFVAAFALVLGVGSSASATTFVCIPAATPIPAPAGYAGPNILGAWPTVNGVAQIPVYSTAPARWEVARVIRKWSRASTVNLFMTSAPCEGCITVRQSSDTVEFHNGDYVGLAYYQAPTGVMERCDISMSSVITKAKYYRSYINRILSHEVGHCLGLDHISSPDSVMDIANYMAPFPSKLDLAWVDQIHGTKEIL